MQKAIIEWLRYAHLGLEGAHGSSKGSDLRHLGRNQETIEKKVAAWISADGRIVGSSLLRVVVPLFSCMRCFLWIFFTLFA